VSRHFRSAGMVSTKLPGPGLSREVIAIGPRERLFKKARENEALAVPNNTHRFLQHRHPTR